MGGGPATERRTVPMLPESLDAIHDAERTFRLIANRDDIPGGPKAAALGWLLRHTDQCITERAIDAAMAACPYDAYSFGQLTAGQAKREMVRAMLLAAMTANVPKPKETPDYSDMIGQLRGQDWLVVSHPQFTAIVDLCCDAAAAIEELAAQASRGDQ